VAEEIYDFLEFYLNTTGSTENAFMWPRMVVILIKLKEHLPLLGCGAKELGRATVGLSKFCKKYQ
jgi:hypothetical protein